MNYLPALAELCQKVAERWRPPPKLTVSEWADKYRRLSSESSAEPGRWRTSRAEYQRGMMDAISDPEIETVVVMSCSQAGKTEACNNIVGYYIHQDPSPILCLQPTLQMAQTWSRDRLAPMLRDTPVLANMVKPARAKNSGNTILTKNFPGGHISIVGANSPAGLASRPIKVLLCDEVDRYPVSAGAEGDPVDIAKRRTATFWNRKIILTSTPTIKGMSRIELAYLASDQQKYFVPCPDCHTMQVLMWANIKWDDEPGLAYYVCPHCGSVIHDVQKHQMIQDGEWRSTAKGDGRTAAFWLNELYSPWVEWGSIAVNFLQAKKFPETLKTWINTSLGETWEDEGEGVESNIFTSHQSDYDADKIPDDILLITVGVDAQGGQKNPRLELEVLGWGLDEETWSLDYVVLPGDLEQGQVWIDLDEQLDRIFKRSDGQKMKIACTCIDSGGTGKATQSVYNYVLTRQHKRIYAIKGTVLADRPICGKFTWQGPTKQVKLYPIGTHTAKDQLYGRLQIDTPGPGYCHFPDWYDDNYFEQLTSERRKTKYRHGIPYYTWELPAGKRNEALDVRVYATAAMHILQPRWQMLARRLTAGGGEQEVKTEIPVKEDPEKHETQITAFHKKKKRGKKGKKGFVNAW